MHLWLPCNFRITSLRIKTWQTPCLILIIFLIKNQGQYTILFRSYQNIRSIWYKIIFFSLLKKNTVMVLLCNSCSFNVEMRTCTKLTYHRSWSIHKQKHKHELIKAFCTHLFLSWNTFLLQIRQHACLNFDKDKCVIFLVRISSKFMNTQKVQR